jgi:hypothetical protein
LPRRLWATTSANFRRRRPSDPDWPSQAAWKQLNEAVDGNLIPVDFPLSILKNNPDSNAAKLLLKDLKNPYYIGDQPGLSRGGSLLLNSTQCILQAVGFGNSETDETSQDVFDFRSDGPALA